MTLSLRLGMKATCYTFCRDVACRVPDGITRIAKETRHATSLRERYFIVDTSLFKIDIQSFRVGWKNFFVRIIRLVTDRCGATVLLFGVIVSIQGDPHGRPYGLPINIIKLRMKLY